LGRQFNALTTMKEIDRAVLSALDTEKIVETVLTRLPEVLPCDFASVTLLDPEAPTMVRTYVPGARRGEKWWRMAVRPEDMQKLRENRESLLIKMGGDIPTFLGPLKRFGVSSILLLPIFLDQELSGIINVGYRNSPEYSPDDLAQARQLADQVAVALSNARLIEKLDQLNWGTLTALARAIDAKSAWTSGHSERVTKLALDIARVMGYTGKDLERMNRGGLLHDIGKIGTPPTVLDKPGKLSEEELRVMREHVRMGAHILKPIPGFAEIIPIVLQHHEWFDGSGYPDGLAGEAISLDARIFAVADCFDALASDRPYRSGLPRQRVMEMIKQGSGRQYDPKVIQAFLEVMQEREKGKSEGEAEPRLGSLTSELDVSRPVEEDFSTGGAGGSKPR
jgi:putative nucleotidyltransferase with HDIG domain